MKRKEASDSLNLDNDIPQIKKITSRKYSDDMELLFQSVNDGLMMLFENKGGVAEINRRNTFRKVNNANVIAYINFVEDCCSIIWIGERKELTLTFNFRISNDYEFDVLKCNLTVLMGDGINECYEICSEELLVSDIRNSIPIVFKDVKNAHICPHIDGNGSVKPALPDPCDPIVGDLIHHPDDDHRHPNAIVGEFVSISTIKTCGCPGFVLRGTSKARSEKCTDLFEKMRRFQRNKKNRKYILRKQGMNELKDRIRLLETRLEDKEREIENNKKYLNDPLVQQVITAIHNGRLQIGEKPYLFFKEQMTIRNLKNKHHLKWVDHPIVFSYFQEIREYSGLQAYRCVIGEGMWKDGYFQGILAAPSLSAINRISSTFQYPPGLCLCPIITIIECLKLLRLVRARATIVGDEMYINSGYSRMMIEGNPLWVGRTCFDPGKELLKLREELMRQYSTKQFDSEGIKARFKQLIQCIDRLRMREEKGELATKVNQIYVNISGVFETESQSTYEHKCFKFPLYWFCQRSLTSDETAGLITSSIIYTQQQFDNNDFTRGKIIIDSFCWDGETGVQGFVNRSGERNEEEKLTYEIFIPILDRKIFFSNDIDHLLKAFRNDLYNNHEKGNLPRKFPVYINGKWCLLPVPLFKVLKKLIEIESETHNDKISRIFKEHLILTTRTKMCQTLVSALFKKEVVLAIEAYLLRFLLGRPVSFEQAEERGEDDEEENEGMDESEENVEDFYSSEAPFSSQKLICRESFHDFHLTPDQQQQIQQQEKKLGLTLNEIVGVVSFINYMSYLKFIFKSEYIIKKDTDWRIQKCKELSDIWDTWLHMTRNERPNLMNDHENIARMDIQMNEELDHNDDDDEDDEEEEEEEEEDINQSNVKYDKDDLINIINFNKLRSNFHCFPKLIESRLRVDVPSAPVDSQSQMICETHFSLARLVSGLNNSPTICEYLQRIGHIIIRNHRKIKRSSYEFVDLREENNAIHRLFKTDHLKTLRQHRQQANRSFVTHFFDLFSELELFEPRRKTQLLAQTKEKISNIVGYCIYSCKRKNRTAVDMLDIIDRRCIDDSVRGIRTTPKSWLVRVFCEINDIVKENMSYQNSILYPEVLEQKIYDFCLDKKKNDFVTSFRYGLDRNDRVSVSGFQEKLFEELLRTFVKMRTYIFYQKYELLPGKLQLSFRGKVDSMKK